MATTEVNVSAPVNLRKRELRTVVNELVTSKSLVSVTLIAIGIFYLVTIRRGHVWGDDFSLYIQHAKNIVNGVPFSSGSYLHVPPYVGPDAYPPVFPLFLAPFIALFGLNLMPMKVGVILLFIGALWLFTRIVASDASTRMQAALVLLIGANPYFWNFKDQIMSELPFLLTAYLSIYLILKAQEAKVSAPLRILFALLIGASLYLAYGTRSVGVVLIGTFVLSDLWQKRKVTIFAAGVLITTALLILTQWWLLRSDRGYYDQFGANREGFLRDWLIFSLSNVKTYAVSLTELWDNGHSRVLRLALTVTMSLLAIVGFLWRAVRRITYFEIFVVLHSMVCILVPLEGGLRYLIPIIPFYMLYALKGVSVLPVSGRTVRAINVALAIAIGLTYIGRYTQMEFHEIRNGVSKAEASDLFEYVRSEMRDSDVVIFTKPRAMALFTGRKSSYYPMAMDDKTLWGYFQKIGATHIIVGPPGLEPYDQAFLARFVNKYRSSLEETYANSDFEVFRIRGIPHPYGRVDFVRQRWINPPPDRSE